MGRIAYSTQCDTDLDGFGNHCDADYNQDGAIDGDDHAIFMADFQGTGQDSGVGTDHNCDGAVDGSDVPFFWSQFGTGIPGPSGLLCAGDTRCVDDDHDGLGDHEDNCTGVANAVQCDTDEDGYGNACDADYNQDQAVDGTDYGTFVSDFDGTGQDSGVGTDHNCDDAVDGSDLPFFWSQFGAGAPGPSALACAGQEPCSLGFEQEVVFTDQLSWARHGFKAVQDSQGRVHGIYVADADGAPRSRLRYVTQAGPDVAPTVTTIVSTPMGTTLGIDGNLMLDIAINSDDEPCLVFSENGTTSFEHRYGCRGASGFTFESIPLLNGNIDAGPYRLAIDAGDVPHLVFYEHRQNVEGQNHRIRHAWRVGAETWQRELIPHPSGYPAPSASSQGACLTADESGAVHFVFGVSKSETPNPPEEVALAHAIKDSAGVWSSAVIRAEIGGGMSPTDHIGQPCLLALDGAGDLHVAYIAGSDDGRVFHGRESSPDWEYTTVDSVPPTGTDVTLAGIRFDDADNAYFSAKRSSNVDLHRVDASSSVTSRTFYSYKTLFTSPSVWNPTAGETTCQVLSSSALRPPEHRFVATTVEDCD